MNVSASITVMTGDEFTLSPTEAADAILKALGGDEKKDIVSVNISGSGQAGQIPVTPPAGPPV
jgi:hypothetical protein